MRPFPILAFAACQGDETAEHALKVLEEASYHACRIDPEGRALSEYVGLIGWSKNHTCGLKHGFPGGCVRIPPENRIDRRKVPPELAHCRQIVYVRESSGADLNSSEAFSSAVLSMALRLRQK